MRSPHLPASPAHRSQLPGLRRWIRRLLDLDEDTAVFLYEFAVPAASAQSTRELRTVVSVQSLDGAKRSWTVPHGLAQLTESDVTVPYRAASLEAAFGSAAPDPPRGADGSAAEGS